MSINDWPELERPREKLLAKGAQHLSDAELLAIFLRVGVRGKSAVDLARELLTTFGDIASLIHSEPAALAQLPGVGPAKTAQLLAAVELARRVLWQEARQTPAFEKPQAVKEWLRLQIGGLPHELFLVLLLDQRHRLIRSEPLFRGTTHEATVYPREVAKLALSANASAVIIAHNHPSGFEEPSREDLAITERVARALELIDVRLLDHFIVTRHTTVSFVERGLFTAR
ncbi:DNA repair protein RadC [Hydrogenophilus islandicus]